MILHHFDGDTFEFQRDSKRLSSQLLDVWDEMKAGEWRTLAQLEQMVPGTAASISARLRDFRKEQFGRWVVKRRYVGEGVWQYRISGRRMA